MSEAEHPVSRGIADRKSDCDDGIARAADAARRCMEGVSDVRISLAVVANGDAGAADAIARMAARHMLAIADDITMHARMLAAAAEADF